MCLFCFGKKKKKDKNGASSAKAVDSSLRMGFAGMQSSSATLKKINLVKSEQEEEVRREQRRAARVTPHQGSNRLQIFVLR